MTPPNKDNLDINDLLKDDPLFNEIKHELTPTGKILKNFLTVYQPLVNLKQNVIPKLAPSSLPILILGETGTGKEMIAESLHADRKGKFVSINCGGIPSELLESEFFGSEKGSYTGAIRDRKGYVEEAENGTLFLDEIGDMPLLLQSKLLRLLESKKYRRVGSTEEKSANFRLVTATNRIDIKESREFRSDLYYRIAGEIIKLPPLQKRGADDIKLIVEKFARNKEIGEEILKFVTGHSLDGNIRELLNIVERYNVLMS